MKKLITITIATITLLLSATQAGAQELTSYEVVHGEGATPATVAAEKAAERARQEEQKEAKAKALEATATAADAGLLRKAMQAQEAAWQAEAVERAEAAAERKAAKDEAGPKVPDSIKLVCQYFVPVAAATPSTGDSKEDTARATSILWDYWFSSIRDDNKHPNAGGDAPDTSFNVWLEQNAYHIQTHCVENGEAWI